MVILHYLINFSKIVITIADGSKLYWATTLAFLGN